MREEEKKGSINLHLTLLGEVCWETSLTLILADEIVRRLHLLQDPCSHLLVLTSWWMAGKYEEVDPFLPRELAVYGGLPKPRS